MPQRIVIATPLEAELVSRITAALPDDRVDFVPELLPPTRYPCDHRGADDFTRDEQDDQRWQDMLADADITFGVPGDDPAQLRQLVKRAPHLRLVQATAAGAGQQVAAAGLTDEELQRVAIASSSGVHAGPLAEFALLGVLIFARGLPRLQNDRAAHRWDHYPTRDVAGRTAVILGTGAIGARIAELCAAFGMHVIGVNSTGTAPDAPVDEHYAVDRLSQLVPRADVLVITVPLTDATSGLVDAALLAALPPEAIVVNVGRGGVVDEPALVDALRRGHLAGAALDVTTDEPPAADSPLWTLPNVLLSPHTAALSPRENQRIVDLFIDNVQRLVDGRPIRNRITADRRY